MKQSHPQVSNVTEWQIVNTCNQRHSLRRKPAEYTMFYISDEYKLVYCHVPKVATSSWSITLTRLYDRNASYEMFLRKIRQRASNFIQDGRYLPRQKVHQRIKKYYKFMFVREPLERLLSAYRVHFLKRKVPRRWHKRIQRNSKSNASGSDDANCTRSRVVLKHMKFFYFDCRNPQFGPIYARNLTEEVCAKNINIQR